MNLTRWFIYGGLVAIQAIVWIIVSSNWERAARQWEQNRLPAVWIVSNCYQEGIRGGGGNQGASANLKDAYTENCPRTPTEIYCIEVSNQRTDSHHWDSICSGIDGWGFPCRK